MVGLVLVSHSSRLLDGLAELLAQIAPPGVSIALAGGTLDGGIGTSADRIAGAIEAADHGDGVVVIPDLGSAVLTVKAVLDAFAGRSVVLVDAPLVEGAVAAAVTAGVGGDVNAVAQAAEDARHVAKF